METYLISYPNSPRLPRVLDWLKQQQITPTLIFEPDFATYSIDHVNLSCNAKVEVGWMALLEKHVNLMKREHSTEYYLVLEDDAQMVNPQLKLIPYLWAVADHFPNYDFIWLDNRAFFRFANVGGGTTGSLIKSSSAKKIAELLEGDPCLYVDGWFVAIDNLLGIMCQRGLISCGSVPVFQESGVESALSGFRNQEWFRNIRLNIF